MTAAPPPDLIPPVSEVGQPRTDPSGVTHLVMCVQAATVRGAHNADPSIPATAAEMVALYDSGPHTIIGGTLPPQLATASQKRWGHVAPLAGSYPGVLDDLRAGAVITVGVHYSRLSGKRGSSGLLLTRWDPAFARADLAHDWHECSISSVSETADPKNPLVWWVDPLSTRGYKGEWVSWSVIVTASLGVTTWRIYRKGAWAMIPLRFVPGRSGTIHLLSSTAIRALRLDTGEYFPAKSAPPAILPATEGLLLTSRPATDQAAYLSAIDGVPVAILARNVASFEAQADALAKALIDLSAAKAAATTAETERQTYIAAIEGWVGNRPRPAS